MDNFNDPVVGGQEVIKRLITVDTLNNGDTLSYALGIGVGDYKGLNTYSHGGADIAHRAFALYFPDLNSGVIAWSNNANFASGRIAYQMADLYFKDALEPEEEVEGDAEEAEGDAEEVAEKSDESSEVTVPLDVLESYAGRYMLAGPGIVMEFSVANGVLKMNMEGQSEATLTPLSRTEFKYEGVDATVEFKTKGREVTGAVHSQGGQDYELEAIPPYEPGLEELMAYTGRYFSPELDVFYKLELQDSTLVLRIRNTNKIKLSSLKKDLYKGDVFFIGEMAFQRDKGGQVRGFELSNGRTKGIRFTVYPD
jgi:hypothetical protein